MNPDLIAYAALVIYEKCTLPDRYYNHHDLIRIAAAEITEATWPGYLEEDVRISIAFTAWEWLEAREIVHLWPVGHLILALGVTNEIPGELGYQRIAAWQHARTAKEFLELADDWTSLEDPD